MKTKKDIDKLMRDIDEQEKSIGAFIKVHIDSDKKESFRDTFIDEYNKNVSLFKQIYLTLKEDEEADWEFLGWPSEMNINRIDDEEDGLLIRLETYSLEIYGEDIPLPIEYPEITSTIKKIQGFDYEYEGIINEYNDPVYGGCNSYLIGNEGRTDYTYTWERLREKHLLSC